MNLRRPFATVGLTTAAVLGTLVMATSAFAADMTLKTTDDNPGGTISFTADGDVLKLCDSDADGKRAVTYVRDGSRTVYWMWASGNGNCITRSASNGSPFNLTEGHTYTFRVCIDNNNDNTSDDQFCNSANKKA
jgi:hypothetical protein